MKKSETTLVMLASILAVTAVARLVLIILESPEEKSHREEMEQLWEESWEDEEKWNSDYYESTNKINSNTAGR